MYVYHLGSELDDCNNEVGILHCKKGFTVNNAYFPGKGMYIQQTHTGRPLQNSHAIIRHTFLKQSRTSK